MMCGSMIGCGAIAKLAVLINSVPFRGAQSLRAMKMETIRLNCGQGLRPGLQRTSLAKRRTRRKESLGAVEKMANGGRRIVIWRTFGRLPTNSGDQSLSATFRVHHRCSSSMKEERKDWVHCL